MVPNSTKPISDIDLYTYAGYRYVQGENPIMINPETPPLGKYIIGLSIMLFNNQRILNLISALLVLLLIYLLAFEYTSSELAASFALLLTVINSLFIDQIIESPQLDIFQVLFLLCVVYFLKIYRSNGNYLPLILTAVAIGCFSSTKIFLLNYVFIAVTIFIFYLFDSKLRKRIIADTLIINAIALGIFTATYTSLFLHGGSFWRFLGTQKWIFEFYSSSRIDMTKLYGNYVSLILFNKWRFWSEGYPVIQNKEWSIVWPIVFIVGILSLIYILVNPKLRSITLFLCLLTINYNIYLFSVPVFPRYLLLLFIPLNITIAVQLHSFVKKYAKK